MLRIFTACIIFFAMAAAAMAQGFQPEELQFTQINFEMPEQMTNHSDVGMLSFYYAPPAYPVFLNIVAYDLEMQPVWILQNAYIFGQEFSETAYENMSFRFDLREFGIEDGVPMEYIMYAWSADESTMAEMPVFEPEDIMEAPVLQSRMNIGGIRATVPTGLDDITIPSLTFSTTYTISERFNIGCQMKNMDLYLSDSTDHNEGCAPAAAANSLSWMKEYYDDINFPTDLLNTYNTLNDLMDRKPDQTVGLKDFIRAKLDFIEMYDLPIKVEFQGDMFAKDDELKSSSGKTSAKCANPADSAFPTSDFVFGKGANKCDVELGVFLPGTDKGHMVTLTGGYLLDGNKRYIQFKHDIDQTESEKDRKEVWKTGPGTIQERSRVEEVTAQPGGKRLRITSMTLPTTEQKKPVDIRFAVSECRVEGHKPRAKKITNSRYCQFDTIAVPPRSRIRFKYPDEAGRCFNTTIYGYRRPGDSTGKMTYKKQVNWNWNKGRTKGIRNNSNKAAFLVYHNDDNKSPRDGTTGRDFEVEFRIEPLSGSTNIKGKPRLQFEAEDPSNESEYAGFSIGGADGSSNEFGHYEEQEIVFDAGVGCELTNMPGLMSPTGTKRLTITYNIEQINKYWSDLELMLEIAEVQNHGELQIICSNGLDTTITILDAGVYRINIGAIIEAGGMSVILLQTGALQFDIDCISIAPLSDSPDQGQIDNLRIDQLNFRDGDNYLANSIWANLSFEYKPGKHLKYLNIVAVAPGSDMPVWIVRNRLLFNDWLSSQDVEKMSIRFSLADFGIASDEELEEIIIGSRVTDDIMWDPPEFYPSPSLTLPVGNDEINALGAGQENIELPEEFEIPEEGFSEESVIKDTFLIGCEMENLDLCNSDSTHDLNACMPAAAANSLNWMRGEYGLDIDESHRELFETLDRLMDRPSGQSGTLEDFIRAKLDLIEMYNLPIKVYMQSEQYGAGQTISSTTGRSNAVCHNQSDGRYPESSWLNDMGRNGCDVEMLMFKPGSNVGHMVTLTGGYTIDTTSYILFKHDIDQADSDEMRNEFDVPPGTRQESSRITENMTTRGKIMRLDNVSIPGVGEASETVYITSVIAECYDPDAAQSERSIHSSHYCEFDTVIVPPGYGLTLEYPEDSSRCFNTTMYAYERPPDSSGRMRFVKRTGWNWNSGKQRIIDNNSPYPQYFVFHNDDNIAPRDPNVSDLGFNVKYTIAPRAYGIIAKQKPGLQTDTPANPESYGGFSLGGRNGSHYEFGHYAEKEMTFDAGYGCILADAPDGMGADLVQDYTITYEIGHYNEYWKNMSLVLGIDSVSTPGELYISSQTTGLDTSIIIGSKGFYELTSIGGAEQECIFDIKFRTAADTKFYFDYIGVPPSHDTIPVAVYDAERSEEVYVRFMPHPVSEISKVMIITNRALPKAELMLYDAMGMRTLLLHNGPVGPGGLSIDWNGSSLPAGVYYWRLDLGSKSRFGRIIIRR